MSDTEETPDPEEIRAQEWYDEKTAVMVDLLGEEHDVVMHALIPYAAGGPLDLYYFPNGVTGTGIVTKELSEMPGEGSSNRTFETYELVMFTRESISLDDAHNVETPFGAAHSTISAILNHVAPYSASATLNPRDTCEFPEDMDRVGGKCLIFDAYKCKKRHAAFGLLLVLEIHRSEMDFAREEGGDKLLAKLKKDGYYPYSDMDRPPVA